MCLLCDWDLSSVDTDVYGVTPTDSVNYDAYENALQIAKSMITFLTKFLFRIW